ncbi:hypothetical protein KM043_008363 [Ampulex compressa]|nr:hypothetical protein KM043_008363 [Ampulex compressa]
MHVKSADVLDLQIALKKLNMYYKSYGPKIMKQALEDSPYAPVQQLVTPLSFGLIFSPESDVRALEKTVRKYPQFILLAGILEGRLLSRNDFLKFGKSDITTERVGLLQTLQTAGGNNLNRQLTHHQTTLVSRLKQIGTKDSGPADAETSESA